ncbi:hypothetical protein BDW59DRAFT_166740 [Aspergillus cavernicola]|uniref:Actin-like ATPase domain-containing protein n=1 Tax=Aspergillus cavernicola TaxID=176166 RepID=A0ABR4HLG9_9EURO
MVPWKTTTLGRVAGFLRKTSKVPNQRRSMKALVSKIKKLRSSDLDEYLVIGIDFGTTYSGAAWATVDDFENDQINLITNWPGSRREEGKAPTELFYGFDEVMWGYDIPANADPVRWFKLLLLRDEDLAPELRKSDFVLRGRKMLGELNKTAVDVIADYLRALWQHIMATIHKVRSKSVITALTFHVVITVPATWKDYARQAMEDAARKAGILGIRAAGSTILTFAPEPEAAALATLYERARDINTNDLYVICDAGGGTVDLISYKVGEKAPIELHEAVAGTGGLCGGIFIDEAFETICKNRLGRQWSNLSQSDIKEIMKNEWEYSIKQQFTPDDEKKPWIVAIPAEAFKGPSLDDHSRKPFIKNGRIHFASSDIRKAYTRVFSDIEELIDGQIRKVKEKKLSVKGVILVGGLGSSPYLYEHLHKAYGKRNIKVLQAGGIRPRTAICRGAIFKGFLDGPSASTTDLQRVSVISTIARQSLGIEFQTPFKRGVHLAKDKYGTRRRGENVSKIASVRHEFYRNYTSGDNFEEAGNSVLTIYQCYDDNPPTRRETNVKQFCEIRFGLEDITFGLLEDVVTNGRQTLKRFSYYVAMVPSGACTEFSVLYEGRSLGSEKVLIES